MKVGVISDIHDHIANLRKAIDFLNKEKVSLVFFCGDLASPFTLAPFKNLKAPVKAVFGNHEGDKTTILELIKKQNLALAYAPKGGLMWDFELNDKRIAIFHGHQPEILGNLTNTNSFNFVFSGHSHNSQIKKIGKTLWVNPGSIYGWTGLDAKSTKPSLAIVDLRTETAKIVQF